ncbi:MAG: 3-oxoacyl-[acyl-carrier protein] reductase, partial [uncultured Sphingomonas sp.]
DSIRSPRHRRRRRPRHRLRPPALGGRRAAGAGRAAQGADRGACGGAGQGPRGGAGPVGGGRGRAADGGRGRAWRTCRPAGQQRRLRPGRPGRRTGRPPPSPDDRPQLRSADPACPCGAAGHDRAPARRHPQRRVHRRFPAGARRRGLLRHQGLCAELHRSVARGAAWDWHPCHRPLSRPGRDRVRGGRGLRQGKDLQPARREQRGRGRGGARRAGPQGGDRHSRTFQQGRRARQPLPAAGGGSQARGHAEVV